MIRLDDLEAKAKAVLVINFSHPNAVYAYPPETILALIRIAKAAKSLKHIGDQMMDEDWEAYDQLASALEEIE